MRAKSCSICAIRALLEVLVRARMIVEGMREVEQKLALVVIDRTSAHMPLLGRFFFFQRACGRCWNLCNQPRACSTNTK